ncbi:MAG TPA: hypothetical protein VKS82_09110 [Streptosporangiaceae bacterium]|nr:hypothetical protein [Streptosporangiaceae bacterium]
MTDAEPAGVAADGEQAVPLVFISHDSRDAPIAEAFSKLLSSVTAGMLKTFRSSDRKGSQGFEYGVEWFPELMRKLSLACDVVCLLTKNSLERPWILFEAGAAKGGFEIPVHGLAIGIPLSRAGTGPFAQLHNCDDDVDSVTQLTMQLIRRLPNAEPDRQTIRDQVEVFINTARLVPGAAGDAEDGDYTRDEVSSSKLFEEIKVMFTDLPSRLEARVVTAFYKALTEVIATLGELELTGASRLNISLQPDAEGKPPPAAGPEPAEDE